MEDSKITFKTRYTRHIAKFSATFGFSLSKKESKELKNVFLRPYAEKLTQYKKAIDKFILNYKQFSRMSDRSESMYKQLPFRQDNSAYENLLDHRNKIISEQLNDFNQELKEVESFTELSEFEKKKITRDKKVILKKKQSEIQKEKQASKSSVETYNRSLRRNFLNDQWKGYNQFFIKNPTFKKIITEILNTHLEKEYSLKIRNSSDYSLKEDLTLLIRDKKAIIKRLRTQEAKFRKELLKRVESWENKTESPFFPSIFTNSELDVQIDKSTFEITFNIKLMYENIIRFAYRYHGFTYRQKDVSISDDRACIFDRLLLLVGLPNFLKTENLENLVKYSVVKGKSAFKFQFDEILKDICRNFVKEKRTLKPAPVFRVPLKKKILQKVKVGIPLTAIIATILVFSFLFINIPSVQVEKHDSVKLDYTVWVSDEDENYDTLNPDVDMIVWLTIVPITENSTTGLVLGLYNNVVEKEISFDSGLIWLNKCIDQDRNGIDDNTGQVALTYGNSTDLYFNICLMMQFRVLDIQKHSPLYFLDIRGNVFLGIIGIVAIIVGGIFSLLFVYIFLSNLRQKRKLKPKLTSKITRSRKFKIYKFGILTGSFPLLLLLILTIMNSVTPLPDLILSSKYNPLVLPAILGFMAGICVIYSIGFLVTYNAIYDRLKRRRLIRS